MWCVYVYMAYELIYSFPSILTGKTAVSVALLHLFGFDHTQSDDVQAKKAAPVFIKNIMQLLREHNVIADK